MRLLFLARVFSRKTAGRMGYAAFSLILAAAFLPLGCGKKPKTGNNNKTPPAPTAPAVIPAAKNTVIFRDLLQKAAADESSFSGVCRFLLARSVLLPLERLPAPEAGGTNIQPKKISIKVLKEKDKKGTGTALVFSGKESLAQAGDNLAWAKNGKGMYSFAAMNGQTVFRVLQANGYHRVILDVASTHPLVFNDASLKDLAQGKIPAFPVKK